VRWDWENDGSYDTGWSTTKTASHSFDTTGTHTIRLVVQDTRGLTDATTRQVTVSVPGDRVFLPLTVRNGP
jgi:PKD repeat protein